MGERAGERVIKKIKNFKFLFSPFSKGGTKGGFLSPYAFFILMSSLVIAALQ
jgi:hypothetical protein